MATTIQARLVHLWGGEMAKQLKTVKQLKEIYPVQARMETFILK